MISSQSILLLSHLITLLNFQGGSARTDGEFLLQHVPLIPHWHQENRRQLSSFRSDDRRRQLDPLQVGALYQGYGTHYVDLWAGTPGQRQTLIVDTGSGVTAFPCSACSDCGEGHHVDENFDESKSSSYQKVKCGSCTRGTCSGNSDCKIGMSYQEGSSWSAFEARDLAYIGGPHDHALIVDDQGKEDIDPKHAFAFSFPMVFGCQTRLTGLFKTQLADGIMGMDDASSSFWSQMKAAGLLKSQQFSLCFTRQPMAERKGTEAGAMTLGGYDERLHTSPLVFAKRDGGRSGFYSVRVRQVYLRHGSGGEFSRSSDQNAQVIQLDVDEASLNHGNVIVDSGTTDTYFTSRISSEFLKAYHKLTGSTFSHAGVSLSDDELRKLPTILIQLAGNVEVNKKKYPKVHSTRGFAVDVDPKNPYDVLLAIPPSHYMEYDEKEKKYIARFYVDERAGSVLGANAMMGHDVFFDIDNGVIGWAESDCNYHDLLTKNGYEDVINTTVTDVNESTEEQLPEAPHSDSQDTSTNSKSIHPAIAACNDAKCRGGVTILILSIFLLGCVLGRICHERSKSRIAYHKASLQSPGDLELSPTINGVPYRDDPEGTMPLED